MSKSDTPRTDVLIESHSSRALALGATCMDYVILARQLERELAQAQESVRSEALEEKDEIIRVLREEMARIAVAVGRSKDGTGFDVDWYELHQDIRALQSPARVAEGGDALWDEEIDAMHAMADELDEDGMTDTASWLRDTARRLTTYRKAPSAPESPAQEQPGNPPFRNCEFEICDLPGQCRSEGKCHHPRAASNAAVATPEVAAMARRLRDEARILLCESGFNGEPIARLLCKAAALIEEARAA